MHPLKTIALGLLAWPAAEIATFFLVAAALGFNNALFLLVALSLAGFLILRHFGGSARRRNERPASHSLLAGLTAGGFAPGAGGILLLIPGFLSSALALTVMFPPSRRWLAGALGRLFGRLVTGGGTRAAAPDVIDLAPGEWKPLAATKLPPGDPSAPAPHRPT